MPARWKQGPSSGLSTQPDRCFDANRVQNFLEAGHSNRLIIAFFIAADHLLADPKTSSQIRLRYALGDPEFHHEGSYFFETVDFGNRYLAGFQLIVFAQFIFQLPNHTFITSTDCRRAFGRLPLIDLRKCSPETLNQGHCTFSLCVALDHDLSDRITWITPRARPSRSCRKNSGNPSSAVACMAGWMK